MEAQPEFEGRNTGIRDHPRVQLFIDAARSYVRLIEKRPQDVGRWCRSILRVLAELYAGGVALLRETAEDLPDQDLTAWELPHGEWRAVYHRLSAQLGDDAWYWMYFEPMKTQVEKAAPVVGNLADDLADVYADVSTALRAWDAEHDAMTSRYIIQWIAGGLKAHWGSHAVDAIGILHRVVTDRIPHEHDS